MTAKEIAKMICYEGLENNIKYYEEEIKEYARQKCKEQRELCAKHGKDDKVEVDIETGEETLVEYTSDLLILTAPEPKFD